MAPVKPVPGLVPRTSLMVIDDLGGSVQHLAIGGWPVSGGCTTANPELTPLLLDQLADPSRHDDPREGGSLVAGVLRSVEIGDLLPPGVHGPVIHGCQTFLGVLNDEKRIPLREGLVSD